MSPDLPVSPATGGLHHGALRFVSLLSAGAASLLLLVMPNLVAGPGEAVSHGWLSLWLWAVCGNFVHGVGYVPRLAIWRAAFSPVLCWPLLIVGSWVLFR